MHYVASRYMISVTFSLMMRTHTVLEMSVFFNQLRWQIGHEDIMNFTYHESF
jgi:hypothetical protein